MLIGKYKVALAPHPQILVKRREGQPPPPNNSLLVLLDTRLKSLFLLYGHPYFTKRKRKENEFFYDSLLLFPSTIVVVWKSTLRIRLRILRTTLTPKQLTVNEIIGLFCQTHLIVLKRDVRLEGSE